MSIEVHGVDFHVLNMRTRFPFRYGIAALTAVPHLFASAEMTVGDHRVTGIASEGLPPKWFTKNPDTSYRDDLADMLHVIETAAGFAQQVGPVDTVFDLWSQVYTEQMMWAAGEGYPPLLWSLGVSLIERAIIHGFCEAMQTTFAQAVRENEVGIYLGEIHKELAGMTPGSLLADKPLNRVAVRHTVGLGDPLTDGEIAPDERSDDGLPQSLESAVAAYGLSHFKIKLSGNGDADIARLVRISQIISQRCGEQYLITLDGNEQFGNVEAFEAAWQAIVNEPSLSDFARHVQFVEQPLHRDVALSADATDDLLDWDERPAIIIDESDALLSSARDAIESGYAGTSHKNCKGVIKGIANACLIAHRNREAGAERFLISGEDLANVGPVALTQDLAVMATLGIGHVERNGHHYFKGLSMYPADVQEQVLGAHADLYRRQESFATVNVQRGQLDITSIVAAPFGTGFAFDPTRYTPLDDWRFESLEA